MARRQSRVGSPEKLIGYGILAVLGLIAFGLAVQQARFNPAVTLSQRAPLLKGRPPAASGQALTATAQLLPEVPGFTPLAPGESYKPESLSDKIDGKAELYLSAGFKEMSCRSFAVDAAGGVRLEAFLYDMGSAPVLNLAHRAGLRLRNPAERRRRRQLPAGRVRVAGVPASQVPGLAGAL